MPDFTTLLPTAQNSATCTQYIHGILVFTIVNFAIAILSCVIALLSITLAHLVYGVDMYNYVNYITVIIWSECIIYGCAVIWAIVTVYCDISRRSYQTV